MWKWGRCESPKMAKINGTFGYLLVCRFPRYYASVAWTDCFRGYCKSSGEISSGVDKVKHECLSRNEHRDIFCSMNESTKL